MKPSRFWAKPKIKAFFSILLAILFVGGCSLPHPVPKPAPEPGKISQATVQRAVDGDTIALTNGEKVRLIGIDTPERGQCGWAEARALMSGYVAGKTVVLRQSANNTKDRYGRLVRYVEVDHHDVGLLMIKAGRAVARYDSRDGYPHHFREKTYWAADAKSPSTNVC